MHIQFDSLRVMFISALVRLVRGCVSFDPAGRPRFLVLTSGGIIAACAASRTNVLLFFLPFGRPGARLTGIIPEAACSASFSIVFCEISRNLGYGLGIHCSAFVKEVGYRRSVSGADSPDIADNGYS